MSFIPPTFDEEEANERAHLSPGTNVTITGTGSEADPYVINSSGGGTVLVGDTNCISLSGDGSGGDPIKASPIIDPNASNILQCSITGISAEISTQNSNCIELDGDGTSGNPLTAVPIIDPAGGNQLTCGVSGLFVPASGGGGSPTEIYKQMNEFFINGGGGISALSLDHAFWSMQCNFANIDYTITILLPSDWVTFQVSALCISRGADFVTPMQWRYGHRFATTGGIVPDNNLSAGLGPTGTVPTAVDTLFENDVLTAPLANVPGSYYQIKIEARGQDANTDIRQLYGARFRKVT